MGTDKMIPRFAFNKIKTFMVRFPDRSEWGNGLRPNRNRGLIIWYIYGARIKVLVHSIWICYKEEA
jgi:hypothetical protein